MTSHLQQLGPLEEDLGGEISQRDVIEKLQRPADGAAISRGQRGRRRGQHLQVRLQQTLMVEAGGVRCVCKDQLVQDQLKGSRDHRQ